MEREGFNSPSLLDSPLPEIQWYAATVAALAPGAQIWAGENGPIGGGNDGTCGALSVCGTFASVIFYADDMGLRAKHGFSQYNRQDLFGGAYGLTNSPSGRMALARDDAIVLRPDFWVAFLWKRTLGLGVLNATSSSRTLRAYAYCVAGAANATLLLINLDASAGACVAAPAFAAAGEPLRQWSLTPGDGGVESADTLLTGELLVGEAPLEPATVDASAGIQLPPLSVTFVSVPLAAGALPACA
jgi:hypothetical protein